jgi:hypothetical protein
VILNVPTGDDFRKQGARFLNAAWANATEHLVKWEEDDADELPEEYYAAAERDLPLWLSLAQTGVDHLVKACIADVSPFLLIAGGIDKWPAAKHGNIRFSDFRTVDAQDLLRALQCISTVQLTPSFVRSYEARRRDRNEQYHTVPEQVLRETKVLIEYVLRATHELVGPGSWIRMRRESIASLPVFQVAPDGVSSHLNGDLRSMLEVLERAKLIAYLGIDKKKRLYSCPVCLRDCSEGEYDVDSLQKGVAQLISKQRGESELFCVACGYVTEVTRFRCKLEGCKGDVLHLGTCLTCHGTNDDNRDSTWNVTSEFVYSWSAELDFGETSGWSVVHSLSHKGRRHVMEATSVQSEAEANDERDRLTQEHDASPNGLRLARVRAECRDAYRLLDECSELASKLGCGIEVFPLRDTDMIRVTTFDKTAPRVETRIYGDAPIFVRLLEIDRTNVHEALSAVRRKLNAILADAINPSPSHEH